MRKFLFTPLLSALLIGSSLTLSAYSAQSLAQDDLAGETVYQLQQSESKLIKFKSPIKRAMLANPERAVLKVISANELLVTAKGLGATELFVNFRNQPDKTHRFVIKVAKDPEQITQIEKTVKELLAKMNPEGTVNFELRSIWVNEGSSIRRQIDEVGNQIDGDSALGTSARQDTEVLQSQQNVGSANIAAKAGNYMVLLSGDVPNLAQKKRIHSVISALGLSVVNMIKVTGPQEVKLEVRVAEVVKGNPFQSGFLFGSKNTHSGIYPPGSNGGNYLLDLASSISNLTIPTSSSGAFQIGVNNAGDSLFGILSVLEGNSLARILARPELIVQSGETAEFLVGGEVPVPVSQNDNAVTVRYKEYGVRLRFSPIITESNEIQMTVAPEISNIDNTASAMNNAGDITQPGFRSRRAKTTVTLKPGQSFVIGGLIQNSFQSSISKVPLLGDIPILGALFRSTSYTKDQTELAIVVTPTLVEPIEQGVNIELPGERLSAPSYSDAFWQGKLAETLPAGQSSLPELSTKIGLEKP